MTNKQQTVNDILDELERELEQLERIRMDALTMKNQTTGVAVTIVQADATRWVLELTDIDCNPPQLVGWKVFKTKGEALNYADLCMKE